MSSCLLNRGKIPVRPVTSLAMNRKRRAGPARRLRVRSAD